MTDGRALDLAIILIYAMGVLAYGLWVARGVRTSDDYTVAGRQLALLPLVGTLIMTEFNPSTMTWFSSLGYMAGPRAFWLCLMFITGLGTYAFLVARRWQRLEGVSIAEMFEARYSRGLRMAVSFATILIMMLFSSGYLIAAAKTFAAALNLPPGPELIPGVITADATLVLTALAITITVLIFTMAGGLISVALTDTVSLLLMAITVPLLLILALSAVSPEAAAISYRPVDPDPILPIHFLFTMNVVIFLIYPLAPWYGQRMFAARNERTAFTGVLIACVATTFLYAACQSVALLYHAADPALDDPDLVMGSAIGLFMGPGLRGLMLAMIFGISQTTVSSIWNTTAAMAVSDFYKGWLRPNATQQDELRAGRVFTLILGVVTLLLATTLLGRLLIAINLFGNTLFAAMFFPCVVGFLWWRASTLAAWICLIVGWTVGLGVAIYANFLAVPEVPFATWARWIYVYLMPAICVLGWAVSRLVRPDPDEADRRVRFFRKVGAPWFGAAEFHKADPQRP